MVVENTKFDYKKIHSKRGYITVRRPEHPRANKDHPYIGEHILVYEEYLSILFDEDVYIPRGWHVHHLNHDKSNNALINLTCIEQKEHLRSHMIGDKRNKGKKRNMDGRICFDCNSSKTIIVKKGQYEFPKWLCIDRDNKRYLCSRCYERVRRAQRNASNTKMTLKRPESPLF